MKFYRIRRWMKRLTSVYPDDQRLMALRSVFSSKPVIVGRVPGSRVAVQCIEDRFYFGLFAAICWHLRDTKGAIGELVVVRSINGAVGDGWRQRLARSAAVGLMISGQWIRTFRGIVNTVAYQSISLSHPISDLLDIFRSHSIWRREKSKTDISKLEILGVPVGDLIIDSYLRFRPSPRFDGKDPFVARLIWQAHRDVRRARAYFRKSRPRLFLTSYSTYIEHGIAVRVALLEGIRVQSFGTFAKFGKELTLSDWFHTPDTSWYRAAFQALDNKDDCLRKAEQQLSLRLAGGIDTATSYMKVSAYARTSTSLPDVADAVVIFLHDFYDSPHIYPDLVFPDFWTWTCFTIDVLVKSGRRFFVKPHPNQISLSSEVLAVLMEKYPGLPLIPASITNVQLAKAGVLCGVTMYGSVAHELAYLGVPTIACARHPHHSFDFCRTAQSMEQYERYLSSPQELPIGRTEMRAQALAFYYMHNQYGDSDSLYLRAAFVAFWIACNGPDVTEVVSLKSFSDLRDSSAFRSSVEQMW